MTVNNRPARDKTPVRQALAEDAARVRNALGAVLFALVAVGVSATSTGRVRADEPTRSAEASDAPAEAAERAGAAREGTSPHHVAPPPSYAAHRPTLGVEVHASFEVPLARDPLCPAGVSCVLGAGVGLGASVERRGADRVGVWAGYDVWLVDTAGVYELGTIHAWRAGVRYVIDDRTRAHPFVSASGFVLAFGDTAGARAVGGGAAIGTGLELEISEATALVAGLDGWVFGTEAFTSRDGVRRAAQPGVDVALQLWVGVSILVDDAIAPEAVAPDAGSSPPLPATAARR